MKHDEKMTRLPNSFFRKNPLQPRSLAVIAHYTIMTKFDEELDGLIGGLVDEGVDEARKATIQQERQRIEETEDPAALVEFMRKGHDIFNQKLLCEKVLRCHEQAMPLLLKRYRTCALDQFIEAAMFVLATGEKGHVQVLRDMYADIRDPYARACACLVFGMQGMEDIPFLLHEYEGFQKDHPEEPYAQYPLLALYLLHGKY